MVFEMRSQTLNRGRNLRLGFRVSDGQFLFEICLEALVLWRKLRPGGKA
jgi:hypothetical protein